jgi:hypothetical protein
MTIQLSPALEKRVARAAKARGIKPKDLVEEALKEYLKPVRKTRLPESAARKRLRELNKYKKQDVDFDTAVRQAKLQAYNLYQDNVEFIEMGAKRYTKVTASDSK